MPRLSELRGVAHNALDHAVSGLGFLTPHVVQFCATAGEGRVRLNLLPPAPASDDTRHPAPLKLAAAACQARFVYILEHARFQLSDVSTAYLEFAVPPGAPKDMFSCDCVLESSKGERYVASMNSESYWSRRSRNRTNPFEALRKLRHGG